MPVPDFQTVMEPLLEELKDGKVHVFNEVFERVCGLLGLTDAERQEKISSGKQTVIKNRIAWARTYLTKAGLLISPSKGRTQITQRGREALAQKQHPIRVKYLKQFPEFIAFHSVKSNEQQDDIVDVVSSITTPDEQIEISYRSMMDALSDELLQMIMQSTPSFFEQLVVDLMITMGYGGSRKEAGQATKATGDDGIDGIIKEDKLGLDTIYLQAKRWKNSVMRPEIDKFIGALTRQHAHKGVFITTSEFSEGAREAAIGLNMKIVLIDGRELARLMIEHGLGVTTKDVYAIKHLDTDYFNED